MNTSVSIMALTWCVVSLVGCSAEHVTAVEESEALVSDGETIPGDPWGVCDLNWICSNPDAGCLGWVEPGSCVSEGVEPCEVERFLIGCSHFCETDADCPVPLSGDALPVCGAGICSLSCETGECPNGYSCVDSPDYSDSVAPSPYPPRICMQLFGPEVVGPGAPMPPAEE